MRIRTVISIGTGNAMSREKQLEFLENTVVPERKFLERWGTHRG